MNITTLILIVGTVLLLTLVLHLILQRRVQGISPRSRYTVFAILLGVGVSAEAVGVVMALASAKPGLASLFMAVFLLFGAGCVLEMRKLSREF
ncbi:MAG: hypothetical protein IT579_09850 [Verrucomicrobia subdivision 3 bacterium]|nr:hypothetical protein [Verrucomicrobiota bacterium]MCC6821021.1 hypothetical protein [Limisphaerales bacterium]